MHLFFCGETSAPLPHDWKVVGSILAVDTISCDPLHIKIFGFRSIHKKSIGTCYNRIKRRVKQIFNSEMENMFEEASCQTAIESQSWASGCV